MKINLGVAILDKNHFNFEEDINNFLDLKIIIDEELEKKELEEWYQAKLIDDKF